MECKYTRARVALRRCRIISDENGIVRGSVLKCFQEFDFIGVSRKGHGIRGHRRNSSSIERYVNNITQSLKTAKYSL